MGITIIASHVRFIGESDVHGPAHAVADFLNGQKKDFIFIKHSIDSVHSSSLEFYINGQKQKKIVGDNKRRGPLGQIFKETLITWRLVKELKNSSSENLDLFIGVDPGNALAGWLAKKFKLVQSFIFYTPDYTQDRFANKLINFLYHLVDRALVWRADQVWNVSSRIVAVRKAIGISDNKNFLVPNSPPFNQMPRREVSAIEKHSLVVVGNFNKTVEYSLLFKVVARLKNNYPDVKLYIIGEGPFFAELKQQVVSGGLAENVLFLGRKEHDEAMEIVSRCAIGFALYTGEYSTNFFGDSKKAREYLAAGLPVIITDVPSTADDIKRAGAGWVVKIEENEIYQKIKNYFDDEKSYWQAREKALDLAREYDLNKILNKLL